MAKFDIFKVKIFEFHTSLQRVVTKALLNEFVISGGDSNIINIGVAKIWVYNEILRYVSASVAPVSSGKFLPTQVIFDEISIENKNAPFPTQYSPNPCGEIGPTGVTQTPLNKEIVWHIVYDQAFGVSYTFNGSSEKRYLWIVVGGTVFAPLPYLPELLTHANPNLRKLAQQGLKDIEKEKELVNNPYLVAKPFDPLPDF